MSDKKDDKDQTPDQEPQEEKGVLRRTYDAVAEEAQELSDDTLKDTKEIRDKYVLPFLRHGKNRIVAAGAGAKTGFFFGMKGGPKGMLVGTFAGAAAGFFGGPAAIKKVEQMLGVKEDEKKEETANDNDTDKSEPPAPPSPK